MSEQFIRPQNVLDEIELDRLINLIPDGAGSYSTPKIRAACSSANGQAESYVQTKYVLPLTIEYPDALIHHTTVLAIYWLHSQSDQVTDALTDRWKETIRWFEAVAKGTVSLGAEPPADSYVGEIEEITQDFSRDKMRLL